MFKVKKAEKRDYIRLVLGGEPSIGKTKGAFNWANNPLWIDLDRRIPEEIIKNCTIVEDVKDYTSLKSVLSDIKSAKEFEYDAIIIDTFTIAETFAREYSITQDYKGKKEDYANYSQGDKQCLPMHINPLLSMLDKIAETHSCDIILIAHSEVRPAKNPNGDNYDKNMLCLCNTIRSRILQWADYVGFAWDQVDVETVGMAKKATGKTNRKISFQNDPRWDAKGPAHLHDDLDFDEDGRWIDAVKGVVKASKTTNGAVTKKQTVKESVKGFSTAK